ncbi:MAG: DNA-3-methyladenine glycosylase [Rubripirellula sp.]
MKLPQKTDCLNTEFFQRKTDIVARELVGKILLRRLDHRWIGGIIVETEAYLGAGDEASHSHRGLTAGNSQMFGSAGTIYVYPIHNHFCFNIVTEQKDIGSAVLIRAIEPIWGIDSMLVNRPVKSIRQLTRGPGCLCKALAIHKQHNGHYLGKSKEFRITQHTVQSPKITTTPRIGISRDQELLLRFFWDGNWYVSGRVQDHQSRPLKPRDIE